MFKKFLHKIKYFGLILFFLFPVSALLAQNFFEDSSGLKVTAEKTGHTKQKVFSGGDSLDTGIGQIIQIVLSLVGIAFMIFLFYGGILWMTAAGSEKRIEQAKNIMSQSIIGLIIVLMAYAISYFIVSIFAQKGTIN